MFVNTKVADVKVGDMVRSRTVLPAERVTKIEPLAGGYVMFTFSDPSCYVMLNESHTVIVEVGDA